MKIPFELLNDYVRDSADLELDGEIYNHVEETEEMDDDGIDITHIYQRQSDNRYFKVRITYTRYGYENYGFEKWANNGNFIEVEKVEIVTTEWRAII